MNNQNGNFVLQMLVRYVACQDMGCTIDAIVQRIAEKAEVYCFNKFGCRVLQACLEYGNLQQRKVLLATIFEKKDVKDCCQSLYATFVMQKILKEMGQEEHIEEVCQILNYTSFNTM